MSPPLPLPIWLAPLEFAGALPWFVEEQRLVERALAEALRDRGYEVLPVEDAHAAIDRMAAGRFPDREGGCPNLPSAADWLEAEHADLPRALARIDCDPDAADPRHGCELVVKISPPNARMSPQERLGLRFPLDASPVRLAATMGALERLPPPPNQGLLGGMIVGSTRSYRPDGPVHVRILGSTGRASPVEAAELEARLAPRHGALAACEEAPEAWLDHTQNPLVLAFDHQGRVERCAPLRPARRAPFADCRCAVLSEGPLLDPGPRNRRLAITVDADALSLPPPGQPGLQVEVEFTRHSADDPTALLGQDFLADDAFRACMREPTPTARWPLGLQLGPDGRVLDAATERPLQGGDPELGACLARAAREIVLPCPFSGGARVNATVLVGSHAKDAERTEGDRGWARAQGIELVDAWGPAGIPPVDAPRLGLTAAGEVLGPVAAAGTPELVLLADARASAAILARWLQAQGATTPVQAWLLTARGGIRLLGMAPPANAHVLDPARAETRDGSALPPGRPLRLQVPPTWTVAGLVEIARAFEAAELILESSP